MIANGCKALGGKVPQAGAWPLSFPFFIDGGDDAVCILVYALSDIRDGNLTGPAIITALENKSRTYYAALSFAYAEDARHNLFVQREQSWCCYLEAASVSRSVCALLASNAPSTRASTSPWRLNTTA